jgi:hypothetical protein
MDMEIAVIPVEQLKTLLIESISVALKYSQPHPLANSPEDSLYGDFKWLTTAFPGVPASTLRIKSAAGEIPGVIKLGKRVLYEKATVIDWLRSQTKRQVDLEAIEQEAEAQMSRQLAKKGGKAR